MGDKKSRVLAIRISDSEQQALEEDAKRRGLRVATLARELITHAENSVKAADSPNTGILAVYHIDDLEDDDLRVQHTPSLRV